LVVHHSLEKLEQFHWENVNACYILKGKSFDETEEHYATLLSMLVRIVSIIECAFLAFLQVMHHNRHQFPRTIKDSMLEVVYEARRKTVPESLSEQNFTSIISENLPISENFPIVFPDEEEYPIDTLVGFLNDYGVEGELSHLIRNARTNQGMASDDDEIVLYELIVAKHTEECLHDLIRNVIRPGVVRDALSQRGEEPSEDASENCKKLLHLFGYPSDVIQQKISVHTVRQSLQNAIHNASSMDMGKALGEGIQMAGHIELLLRLMIRAMVLDKLKTDDVNFTMKELTGADYWDISRATLGNLLNRDIPALVEKIGPEEEDPIHRLTLIDSLDGDVVHLRNQIPHSDEHKPQMSREESIQLLVDFSRSAIELLNAIEPPDTSSNLIPIPIQIKSSSKTEHGYIEIIAKGLEPNTDEKVYIRRLDKEPKPGDIWYILPKSNPLRINPLLFRF